MSKIIEAIEQEQMGKDIPAFAPGDTVVVQVKVKEGTRERLQAFEGVVIAKRNRGLNSSFTVRKISHGEGVERVFQTYSPSVSSIEVKRPNQTTVCSACHTTKDPAAIEWFSVSSCPSPYYVDFGRI